MGRMMKTISATDAARRFSDLLDAVEHRGTEFIVERRGKRIATIAPTSLVPRRVSVGEWLDHMRNGPQPDPEFADDVRRIRRELNTPPEDPWARSSTRRS